MTRAGVWTVRVGIGLLILGVAASVALWRHADALVEQRVRPATVELLERRFNSRVELGALRVTLMPKLSIRGEGLVLRYEGRTDIPPLITLRAFTLEGTPRELWNRRVDRVHVDGLEIMIPPRRGDDMPEMSVGGSQTPSRDDVHIGELVAENSLLTIMSKREGKPPRVFQLRDLRLEQFELSQPIAFETAITNPVPHGEIAAKGTFGPWQAETPSLTPVDGTFLFDADLGTIDGIGGALHAEGTFSGPLEMIRTTGRTRTDGFHLSSGGATFPLRVDYEAVVDGTNGDTILERVDAVLGTSRIAASGAIVHVDGAKGRRITLDTRTRGGRLEDFVQLATRVRQSPLTGAMNLDARLDIPPGPREVIERMHLAGTFTVARARFTDAAIQDRVDELARRGLGRPTDETIDDVLSNFRGTFRLRDAQLHLSALRFSVDGATVQLAGSYDTAREVLDFRGELRLAARASQTQTGWKRFVLKLFDPLLDGPGAGTVLPISITGTREQPEFRADLKKALLK